MASLNSRKQSLQLSEIYDSLTAGRFSEISLDHVLSAVRQAASTLESFEHPLGFYHTELTPEVGVGPGERLRLHFWLDDRGTADSLGSLHEHTWHLTSLVLAGALDDTNLEAVPAEGGEYLGSRIVYGSSNSSERLGRFDLRVLVGRTIAAGDHYKIASRTIHLSRVARLPTVTLVHSIEDGRGDGPLVLSRYDEGQGVATASRAKVSTLQALEELTQALSKGGSPLVR